MTFRGHTTSPTFRWPSTVKVTLGVETRFYVRRYVHHRTGCSICSTSDLLIGAEYNRPTAFAERPLLAGNDQLRYSWCSDNVPYGPFVLMPAHGHSISLSHTHALLLPSLLHLLASGCREAISDFTYPPFLRQVTTHRFLGSHLKTFSRKGYVTPPARVRKLPPSPCLRAPIGDHHPMICD